MLARLLRGIVGEERARNTQSTHAPRWARRSSSGISAVVRADCIDPPRLLRRRKAPAHPRQRGARGALARGPFPAAIGREVRPAFRNLCTQYFYDFCVDIAETAAYHLAAALGARPIARRPVPDAMSARRASALYNVGATSGILTNGWPLPRTATKARNSIIYRTNIRAHGAPMGRYAGTPGKLATILTEPRRNRPYGQYRYTSVAKNA